MNALDRRRRSGSRPPWITPKSAWSGRRCASSERTAQRWVRSVAIATSPGSVEAGGTGWSKATATSAPSAAWIAIERSAVNRWREPSWWLRNVTPSSSITLRSPSDTTWKPPESVRIGCGPAHEPVEAAEALDPLVAGTQVQVVRVGEDDLRAGLLEVVRVERLDRRVRADGHEGRRLDDPVRQVEPAQPRPRRAVGGRRARGPRSGPRPSRAAQASSASAPVPGPASLWPRTAPRGWARARRGAAARRSPGRPGGPAPGPWRPVPAASGPGSRSGGGTARRRPRPSPPPRRGRPPGRPRRPARPRTCRRSRTSSRRSVASRPSASISRTPIASSTAARVTRPSPWTSAWSRTRLRSRFTMRGVARPRRGDGGRGVVRDLEAEDRRPSGGRSPGGPPPRRSPAGRPPRSGRGAVR